MLDTISRVSIDLSRVRAESLEVGSLARVVNVAWARSHEAPQVILMHAKHEDLNHVSHSSPEPTFS